MGSFHIEKASSSVYQSKKKQYFLGHLFLFIVINENLCTDYSINTYAITSFHCIPLKRSNNNNNSNNMAKLMKTLLILALSTSASYLPNSILHINTTQCTFHVEKSNHQVTIFVFRFDL